MAGSERFVRVFNPEELRMLASRSGASEKAQRAGWQAIQTKLQYDEELDRPGNKGADGLRARGLLMEPTDPLLTVRRTADHCAVGTEPIELRP